MAVLQAKHGERRVWLPVCCVVGRVRSCDLEIADEHVSGQHAALEWNGTCWTVRDLGSSNGTFVGELRLTPGTPVELSRGQELRFGRTRAPWLLIEDGPPTLMAVGLAGTGLVLADGGYLVLPSGQEPEVAVYQDPEGRWIAEAGGELRPLQDREVLRTADGGLWRVHLPISGQGTLKDGGEPIVLAQVTLRFAFTRDEEHVELTARAHGRRFDLKARSHHYPLLVLARRRLADRGAGGPAGEHGWIRQEELLKMLRIEENHLNISVHRARTQLGQIGVVDAVGLVERRVGTRQLRIGVAQLEVAPLDANDDGGPGRQLQ